MARQPSPALVGRGRDLSNQAFPSGQHISDSCTTAVLYRYPAMDW
nr:MAG TPA: hypothetical protein [Caudoviricetes sp.]